MKLRKILIIDDSDEFRAMLKEYLKRHNLGAEIFEASTGEMGIAKASCIRPDIVLMDVSLPKINGLEATQQIKTDNPDSHIIILTMFSVQKFKEESKRIKADDFIGKSEIDEKLVPAIRKCFESTQNSGNRKL
ncbi:MAG: response regulator transcription factor [Candidatus Omnitrophica bacterium]|nr:response regulator transcription factor [Candidatus Omnitrophota bacterium]